jgi:hypothetical protein
MKYFLVKCKKTSQNRFKTVKSILILNTLHCVLRLIFEAHRESIKKTEPPIGLLHIRLG